MTPEHELDHEYNVIGAELKGINLACRHLGHFGAEIPAKNNGAQRGLGKTHASSTRHAQALTLI